MTTALHDNPTGELQAVDPDDETRNLAEYLKPKDYVGRHRVADNELSTMQKLGLAAHLRAEASAAMTEAVA